MEVSENEMNLSYLLDFPIVNFGGNKESVKPRSHRTHRVGLIRRDHIWPLYAYYLTRVDARSVSLTLV